MYKLCSITKLNVCVDVPGDPPAYVELETVLAPSEAPSTKPGPKVAVSLVELFTAKGNQEPPIWNLKYLLV